MENKSSAKQWIILGVSMIALLLVYAILGSNNFIYASGGTEDLLSGVLGWGGIIFVLIGAGKAIWNKFHGQSSSIPPPSDPE